MSKKADETAKMLGVFAVGDAVEHILMDKRRGVVVWVYESFGGPAAAVKWANTSVTQYYLTTGLRHVEEG